MAGGPAIAVVPGFDRPGPGQRGPPLRLAALGTSPPLRGVGGWAAVLAAGYPPPHAVGRWRRAATTGGTTLEDAVTSSAASSRNGVRAQRWTVQTTHRSHLLHRPARRHPPRHGSRIRGLSLRSTPRFGMTKARVGDRTKAEAVSGPTAVLASFRKTNRAERGASVRNPFRDACHCSRHRAEHAVGGHGMDSGSGRLRSAPLGVRSGMTRCAWARQPRAPNFSAASSAE
jgi:hypothetical protein